jgi:hypothetical protein
MDFELLNVHDVVSASEVAERNQPRSYDMMTVIAFPPSNHEIV